MSQSAFFIITASVFRILVDRDERGMFIVALTKRKVKIRRQN